MSNLIEVDQTRTFLAWTRERESLAYTGQQVRVVAANPPSTNIGWEDTYRVRAADGHEFFALERELDDSLRESGDYHLPDGRRASAT